MDPSPPIARLAGGDGGEAKSEAGRPSPSVPLSPGPLPSLSPRHRQPVTTARYWHRSLAPKKLIEVGFSRLAARMTMVGKTLAQSLDRSIALVPTPRFLRFPSSRRLPP